MEQNKIQIHVQDLKFKKKTKSTGTKYEMKNNT